MNKLIALISAAVVTVTSAFADAPVPAAVWDGSFDDGSINGNYTLTIGSGNTVADGAITIGSTEPVKLIRSSALSEIPMTVILKYSNYTVPSANVYKQFISCSGTNGTNTSDDYTKDILGICGSSGGGWAPSWQGVLYSSSAVYNTDKLANATRVSMVRTTDGLAAEVGANSLTKNESIKATSFRVNQINLGGTFYHKASGMATVMNQGLKITAVAVFETALTKDEIDAYTFPSEGPITTDYVFTNQETPSEEDKAIITSSRYVGTVTITNWNAAAKATNKELTLADFGNAKSKIRIINSYAYLPSDGRCDSQVEFVKDESGNPALTINNGFSNHSFTFAEVTGDGDVKNTSGATQTIKFSKLVDYTGEMTCGAKTFEIGAMEISGDERMTFVGTPTFASGFSIQFAEAITDEPVKIIGGSFTAAAEPTLIDFPVTAAGAAVASRMLKIDADGVYVKVNDTGKINSLVVAAGETKALNPHETLDCLNPPSLNAAGTLTVDVDGLKAGAYDLAVWTGLMAKGAAGYGKPQIDIANIPEGWEAKLVFQTKKISLLLRDPEWLARKPLTVWPFGDSITEGYNHSNRANYRIQLFQKLELLGYNVKSVGWWTSNYNNEITGRHSCDPTGTVLDREDWSYHSGVRSARCCYDNGNNNVLADAVETGLDQAGDPDVVLIHIGTNDGGNVTVEENFNTLTNMAWRIINAREGTKVVLSTILPLQTGHSSFGLNSSRIEPINAKLRDVIAAKAFPEGRVYLADLHEFVPNTPENYVADHTHPDWIGHDKMSDGWLSVITNVFTNVEDPRVQSNVVRAAPAVDELGAAAKSELAVYRSGFAKLASLKPAADSHFERETDPMTLETGVTGGTKLEKVAYFMELVNKTTKIHRWVWVDMDAFGDKTFAACGFPYQAARQQVVTSLHVKSNTGAIADVAPGVTNKTGFIEFSPYNYGSGASSVEGAPANKHGYDWNDNLSGTTGGYGCFQVHAIAPEGPRVTNHQPAQVLFAYNRWGTGNTGATEIGIGNFSKYNSASVDYTGTVGMKNLDASAYEVINIEIWGKKEGPATPDWIDDDDPDAVASYLAWAEAKGVTDPSLAKKAAYLFNCANTDAAVREEALAFKITITFDENGDPVVSQLKDTYNVKPVIKGATEVNGSYELDAKNETARFFKGFIEL